MELNSDVWIRLIADDYAATLPAQAVLDATPQGSHLSTLVEFELKKGRAEPSIRLNCSAEEAKELVAAIRQGSSYEPPANSPRLLGSLKRTFDFLGVPSNNFPATSATQEVLVVPSYYIGCEHLSEEADHQSFGVLMYSSSAQGWANRIRGQDPRPHIMRSHIEDGRMGSSWLAAVLRSESTGAGQDLMYMLPNDTTVHSRASNYTPVLFRNTLEVAYFTAPPLHRNTGAAAMTAAGGKLYLLGGVERSSDVADGWWGEPPQPGSLEVYDPHLDTWFAATPPVPGYTLVNHVLVTNKQEGMLLAVGGKANHDEFQDVTQRRNTWHQIGMYDIKAGKWTLNPSGCTWPGSAHRSSIGRTSVAAAAADDFTIMILRSGSGSAAADAPAGDLHVGQPTAAAAAVDHNIGHVDLLDLRMWRFRSGRALQRDVLHGMSLVEYDGKVVAVGGAAQQLPIGQWGVQSSRSVSAYDLRSDHWTDMPDLPFSVGYASAIVMRVPSILPRI